MNNNFTAQELITLHKTAVDTFSDIVEAIKAVHDVSQHMSDVVKSEDSNLAGAWDSVAQSIVDPVKTAESSFDFIGNELNSYVQKTVANEQNAEAELAGVGEELGRLDQIAGGLVDLGASVGGVQSIPGPTAGGDTPSVIYAPPTPSDSGQSGPSVIYAPPTPDVSGVKPNVAGAVGGGVQSIPGPTAGGNTPPVIYAPPTPSAPSPSGPSVIYAPPTPGVSGIINNN